MGFGWFLCTHLHQFIHGHSWSSATWWKTVFGRDRFSANDIPDLTGQVAIVTGANKGIGYHITLELAAHGCHVFMACRSRDRAEAAMAQIRQELAARRKEQKEQPQEPGNQPDGHDNNNNNNNSSSSSSNDNDHADKDQSLVKLDFLQLDLADMRQSHEAALAFLAKGLPLHLLVNNAGIGTERSGLIDGIECHMAVNHFGHFAFTLPLIDRLVASQPSRVVIVSSIAHECSVKGGVNLARMNDPTLTDNHYRKYAQSKAANILFAKALARRLAPHPAVHINAVHPGVVDTAIFDHMADYTSPRFAALFLRLNHRFAMTPARGALTPLYCATSPDIVRLDYRGQWFIPVGVRFWPRKILESHSLQDRLWEYSEALLAARLAAPQEPQPTSPEKEECSPS